MTSFPGWVPLRGSIGFIQFDDLKDFVVTIPKDPTLRAWPKLRELERRWLHFEWFTHGVAKRPEGFRSLIDDTASAYLMTFEAALQVIGFELHPGHDSGKKLNGWLRALPAEKYDLTCRGLRTLRHAEAHIRPGKLEMLGGQLGDSVFTGSGWGQTLPWCFPKLDDSNLPLWPALEVSEVDEWNTVCDANLAATIMRRGVKALFDIALEAEKRVAS